MICISNSNVILTTETAIFVPLAFEVAVTYYRVIQYQTSVMFLLFVSSQIMTAPIPQLLEIDVAIVADPAVEVCLLACLLTAFPKQVRRMPGRFSRALYFYKTFGMSSTSHIKSLRMQHSEFSVYCLLY